MNMYNDDDYVVRGTNFLLLILAAVVVFVIFRADIEPEESKKPAETKNKQVQPDQPIKKEMDKEVKKDNANLSRKEKEQLVKKK